VLVQLWGVPALRWLASASTAALVLCPLGLDERLQRRSLPHPPARPPWPHPGDKAHEEMREACFDYLTLGGIYSSGPISLLGGLNPRPSVLVAHFFMVIPAAAAAVAAAAPPPSTKAAAQPPALEAGRDWACCSSLAAARRATPPRPSLVCRGPCWRRALMAACPPPRPAQVALYGVGRLLLPRPSVKNVWLAVLLLIGASRIIVPIIWAEGLRAVFLPALAPKPAVTRMTRAFSTGAL
jgi:hypothetical protein